MPRAPLAKRKLNYNNGGPVKGYDTEKVDAALAEFVRVVGGVK